MPRRPRLYALRRDGVLSRTLKKPRLRRNKGAQALASGKVNVRVLAVVTRQLRF